MTLAARVAPHVPPGVIARLAGALYPRFEPELARLDDFLPPAPALHTAVDVGGWYGPWSRKLAGRARQVVTLEPVPHLSRVLTATAPTNVRVIAAAASDRDGTGSLWLPRADGRHDDRGDRGTSSLVRRDLHGVELSVAVVTLDGLGLHDVGFMKIDVDGNELPVLQGAHTLLTRDRPALFIELETRIQPVAPVVDLLIGLGYTGWVLPARGWVRLDDFDLPAHQAATQHVVSQGLVRRAVTPQRPRYVNSVLFLPDGHRPRGA
ncbi:FkbM family methyltransferase [Streptomyces sp. NPDC060194]|uniref:FkbM family methyltransferase n=1 Tax=Streptomyces sp. NPDC060194 TaxID=3347069 RepID=UPI003655EDBF